MTWNKLKEVLPDWKCYRGNCPEGTFPFEIIQTAWGKKKGIHVFAEIESGEKFWFFIPLFRSKRDRWNIYQIFRDDIEPPAAVNMSIDKTPSGISTISKIESRNGAAQR
ncbi:MAG: hypothetical protein WAX69_17115 [Victivallales bacterium]